jgi:hypothetical protein
MPFCYLSQIYLAKSLSPFGALSIYSHNKIKMSDRTSTDKIQHERIFTNSELLVLEEQIKYLVTKQKDMKTFVKEEFKNFRSRLEKEIRDAQQEGKIDLAITIEKALDLCTFHSKMIDEEVDKDTAFLDEQIKTLKNLRYEKDYWKELELKMIIGEDTISSEDFAKDVDENMQLSQEKISLLMKNLRGMVDRLEYDNVVTTLMDLCKIVE